MLKQAFVLVMLLTAVACGSSGTSTTASPPPAATPTRILGLSGNLVFGNVLLGNTGTAAMTVANTGNATMTVTGMTVSGGLGSVVAASWTNGAIGAGLTQQVTIQFTPTSAQTYSGTLTVNSDQTSGTNTLAISGTGTGQPSPSPSPTPSPSCTYTLSLGFTIDGYPSGGSFPTTVTTTTGCAWTAVSGVSWIHVQTPSSGTGSGAFTFTVDANTGSARTGTVTVAGKTITFNQTAATPTPPPTPTPTPSPTCNGQPVPAIVDCLNGQGFLPPTAKCNDGAYSCSQNRSGTCSSHNGVACYVCPGPICQ